MALDEKPLPDRVPTFEPLDDTERAVLANQVRAALSESMHGGVADSLQLRPGTHMGPALDALSESAVAVFVEHLREHHRIGLYSSSR